MNRLDPARVVGDAGKQPSISIHAEDIVPNPDDHTPRTYDDATIAAAYITWLQQGPDRVASLPDRGVLVNVKAGPMGTKWGPHTVEAQQGVPIGDLLHNFLDPGSPGAGIVTTDTLHKMGITVRDLGLTGWHIHPNSLSYDQRRKWTTGEDLRLADRRREFYRDGRAPYGYAPAELKKDANQALKNPEPEWAMAEIDRINNMRAAHADADALKYMSPAEAWATLDCGIHIEEVAPAVGESKIAPHPGLFRISPETPLDTPKYIKERDIARAEDMGLLYANQVLTPRHISTRPGNHPFPAHLAWLKEPLNRGADLAHRSDSFAGAREIHTLSSKGNITVDNSGKIPDTTPAESAAVVAKRALEKFPTAEAVDEARARYRREAGASASQPVRTSGQVLPTQTQTPLPRQMAAHVNALQPGGAYGQQSSATTPPPEVAGQSQKNTGKQRR